MAASNAHTPERRATGLLAQRMVAATAAIHRALTGLDAGAQLSVLEIANAFAAVRAVLDLRHCDQGELVGSADSDFHRALTDYRSALKELHQQLPRVHGWLLAEKTRLEAHHSHAASVQSWLQTNQQTK